MTEPDDERHRREEAERRAKRKAAKISKSDAQREKQRRQKEHRERVLNQQGGGAAASSISKSSKKEPTSSAFQELFSNRAQGFQIDFRFRNAPPRPPVGPVWVGNTLKSVLHEQCRQYAPAHQSQTVEGQYVWKLHSEPDLGVPLAPTAMDMASYDKARMEQQADESQLHEDDLALLDWKGSLGDTAADQKRIRQEEARAAASGLPRQAKKASRKAFSRVLDDPLQTWMKKTTYLSNDYSRKVHDFKSLAQTKQELAVDLEVKQQEIAQRRSTMAIDQSFADTPIQHPTRKNLKPKAVLQVLPNVQNWGHAYTHVVIDKAPNLESTSARDETALDQAVVANVTKKPSSSRMNCQLWVPAKEDNDDGDKPETLEEDGATAAYQGVQEYALDVIPLREEDTPHTNFVLLADTASGVATYVPIASRVQLSTGRPMPGEGIRKVGRRELTPKEVDELEERMAEVDQDLAEKHHVEVQQHVPASGQAQGGAAMDGNDKNDGEMDDFGDDDDDSSSDDEAVFGGTTKTIVAEG